MCSDRPERQPEPPAASWMSLWLRAAGVYNVVWGAAAVLAPRAFFEFAGMLPPNYLSLWQCIGMIVGVYGVGYWIAASDPYRHWPIVLVGLLGKVFGPMGFVMALARGEFPAVFGWTILTNDVVWWVPFGLILLRARQYHVVTAPPSSA